jgi:hypothetical protein
MVAKYYVALRPRTNENHAIHKEGCPFLPDDEQKIYLGKFSSGHDAVRESQQHFIKTKSCLFCSRELNENNEKPSKYKLVKNTAELPVPLSYHQSLLCCLN